MTFIFFLAPPSPLIAPSDPVEHAVGHSLLHHTLPHQQRVSSLRAGAQSPPLPPPPPPEDEHEASFGRPHSSGVMPIVPDEEDLPGWVPKNYIEKGKAIRGCV